MKQSFYGGVHPNDRKEATNRLAVVPLSTQPKQVVIAMSMHIGAPCKPVVAVGDQVAVGQKIGEIAGLGAPVHASVSGQGCGGGAAALSRRKQGYVRCD